MALLAEPRRQEIVPCPCIPGGQPEQEDWVILRGTRISNLVPPGEFLADTGRDSAPLRVGVPVFVRHGIQLVSPFRRGQLGQFDFGKQADYLVPLQGSRHGSHPSMESGPAAYDGRDYSSFVYWFAAS